VGSPGRSRSPVFTIGHTRHELRHFLDLLREHAVELVVDVRSQPTSRFARWSRRRTLARALADAGLRYLFLGAELGGRPEVREFYDAAGRVLYARLAESPSFLEGMEQLEPEIGRTRLALLCSEEDPTRCHRRLLVGRVLIGRGIEIQHIRGDGRVEPEGGSAAIGDRQIPLVPDDLATPRAARPREAR
jgi:uncharacterized protein (DUF488 family)